MKDNYTLIEVVERDISEPMRFATMKQARREMAVRFAKAMGITARDMPDLLRKLKEGDYDTGDYDNQFGDTAARCERRGQNYDWRIFRTGAGPA